MGNVRCRFSEELKKSDDFPFFVGGAELLLNQRENRMYLGRTIERINPRGAVHSTAALTPPAPVRTVVVSISGEKVALFHNSDVAFVDGEAMSVA